MLSVCVCLSVCSQGVRHVTINRDTFDLIIQAVRTSPHLQLVAYGEQAVRTILECFLVVQYCWTSVLLVSNSYETERHVLQDCLYLFLFKVIKNPLLNLCCSSDVLILPSFVILFVLNEGSLNKSVHRWISSAFWHWFLRSRKWFTRRVHLLNNTW